MQKFEFYKSYYEDVLKEKEQINSSISLPITILTLLAAVIYNFVLNFKYEFEDTISYIFVILTLLNGVVFLITLIYIIRCYSGFTSKKYSYKYLPYPKELKKYYDSLTNEYKDAIEEQKDLASYYLEETILEYYIEAGSYNAYLNSLKAYYSRMAKIFLIITLFITLLTLIPYVLNSQFYPKENYKNINFINK